MNIIDVQTPNWGPLEATVPMEHLAGFMWMARIEQDGTTIEAYKHGITRSYLNIDHTGQCWKYIRDPEEGDRHIKVDTDIALRDVFDGIEDMGWTRETAYDEEFIRAKHEALREAGWEVITVGMDK